MESHPAWDVGTLIINNDSVFKYILFKRKFNELVPFTALEHEKKESYVMLCVFRPINITRKTTNFKFLLQRIKTI